MSRSRTASEGDIKINNRQLRRAAESTVRPTLEELRTETIAEELKALRGRVKELAVLEKQRKLNDELYQDNNGWNHNLEMIAAKIGEKASGFRWMHRKCIKYFNLRYQVLGIVLILIQTAAATASVTQISTCSTETTAITILVSILMYLTAVLSAFAQFKNWGARTQSHKQGMTDFAGVEQNIRIELGKYRRDRKNGGDYTEWISGRFDEVNATSPEVPGTIQKKYRIHIQGKDLAEADTIDPIAIKEDSPKGKEDSPKEKTDEDPPDSPEIPSEPLLEPSPPPLHLPHREESVVPLEASVTETQKGDVVIDFNPVLNRERDMYEIQRFLQGDK
jgi:hypothetical protein